MGGHGAQRENFDFELSKKKKKDTLFATLATLPSAGFEFLLHTQKSIIQVEDPVHVLIGRNELLEGSR